MSRGLSRQQLRILGLAVAVSRFRHGEPQGHVPQESPRYRVPVANATAADVDVRIAAHFLGGVGLRRREYSGNTWSIILENTPAALSVRASLSRAITGLIKRGLLAYFPPTLVPREVPETSADQAWDWGYVLTPEGLTIGLQHELTIPDLPRRLWLMWRERGHGGRRHPNWEIVDVLPSPEFAP